MNFDTIIIITFFAWAITIAAVPLVIYLDRRRK